MLQDKLINKKIRDLWVKRFPKRHAEVKSRLLCESFRLIIKRRAGHTDPQEEDILFELHHVLETLGIPREQFYKVERESEDE